MPSERNYTGHEAGQGRQSVTEGLSLLFAPGDRPAVAAVEKLLEGETSGASPARISAREDAQGWAELLASGLTFELSGLAPAPADVSIAPEHFFGLPADMSAFDLEAVTVVAGRHISAGRAMLPVVRTSLAIAANLALQLPVKAVCWQPARSWMDARYFARQSLTWLSGGAFPALGLTAFTKGDDGWFRSVGLAYFTDQELLIEPLAGEGPADVVKLGVRLIDHLVRHGALDDAQDLTGPSGEPLRLEIGEGGRVVRARREG